MLDVMWDEISESREKMEKVFGQSTQRDSDGSITMISTRCRRIHLWTLYAGRIYQTLGKNFPFLTRGYFPKNHYILFSGGLRHCVMNYEEYNVRIHTYVDFIGSHRTSGCTRSSV